MLERRGIRPFIVAPSIVGVGLHRTDALDTAKKFGYGAARKSFVNEWWFTFRNCEKEIVVKKVLTLILALGLVVAFTSAAVAMGICGGPKAAQLQANADTTDTQQSDQIVVAQAEMTEDTSPVTSDGEGEEEDTDSSN